MPQTKSFDAGRARKELLFNEMVRWSNARTKKCLAIDIMVAELFQFVGVDAIPDFYSLTGWKNALKNSAKINAHIRDALYEMVCFGYGHLHEKIKIVDDYSLQSLREVYENDLPLKSPKDAKPETYEVKAGKEKTKGKAFAETLKKFQEAAK